MVLSAFTDQTHWGWGELHTQSTNTGQCLSRAGMQRTLILKGLLGRPGCAAGALQTTSERTEELDSSLMFSSSNICMALLDMASLGLLGCSLHNPHLT